jgi:uncharacterized iron-regulated membrane protein
MELTSQKVRLTNNSQVQQRPAEVLTTSQQWLQQPARLRVRKALFQIHLWVGAGVGLYVVLMSLTGSIIVFRNELSGWFPMERLVKLHGNLLLGRTGRLMNGVGAMAVTTVCLTGAITSWPGLKNWRRCLKVRWGSRLAPFNGETHRALGVWCFLFILMWGISGLYFSFPQVFYALAASVDPADKYTDAILFRLSTLHFGRFGWSIEMFWAVLGLVPAILAITGAFVRCRRMSYQLFSSGQDNLIRQQKRPSYHKGLSGGSEDHQPVVER